MPTKRDVLEHLKRDELLAAVERYDLTVRDRRVRTELVEALAGARRAPLPDILDELPRTRLKEICRDLGLDDSGREKAVIIERLAGRSPHPPAPSPASLSLSPPLSPSPGEGGTRAKRNVGEGLAPSREGESPKLTPVPAAQLTREALERHLWAAADILRGSIDSSDYKNYILGLLFLKRLSDRFEEECEALRAAGHDPDDRDEHQFFVPLRARWSELRKVTTDVGRALNKAAEALEEDNPSLEGVLAGIDFNNEHRLGDVRQRDTILLKLLQHYSEINLANASLSEPDMLGGAYEFLIERFADDAGKKGGEFRTPHQVGKLMVEILAPEEGMRICDPTCGSGGLLIQCAKYVERHGGDPRNLSLFGQEKNLGTWAICKMNMLLHGRLDDYIAKGDTIRDPKLLVGGDLMLFDIVIANPPFSLENWGREVAENDPFGRFRFGVPPKSKGDLAFVQHMISTLNDHGRMAVVMPHGVLFRGGAEEAIRKGIMEEDLLEAVIGLPPNLFYGTGIRTAILIINREKRRERKGRVLLVDASHEYREGGSQNFLRDQDIERISSTFLNDSDLPGYAASVTVSDIAANDFSLHIRRYIHSATEQPTADLSDALALLREAEAARDAAKAAMDSLLRKLGYE